MSETRARQLLRTKAAERKRARRVAGKVAATLGNDFFESLVKHIADALDADCVYIGELIEGTVNRIDTLAVCLNGEWAENFEQELPGTASAHVVTEGSFAYGAGVTELFPMDLVLERLGAEAFVGCRLTGSGGQVLGVLTAVYSQGPADVNLAKSLLEAFAPRATAELERKCDLRALRKADERHRAFIASSMDAMWRIEFEKPIPVHLDEEEQLERIYRYGYMAECNEALARLAGAPSAEELVGARFAAIVPRDNSEQVEELRSAIRSGYRTTVVETTPLDSLGRRTYRLRSELGIVENGELQRIWGTTRDNTQLRRAELTLEASERRSREVLERLQLPAVVVDPGGQILFANDALLRLGRWARPELASRNWFDVLADQESRDRWKAALLYPGSGPTFAHFESSVLSADGDPRLVSWNTALMLDADGRLESIAATGTDVTSQRAVEAQIRQAQKLDCIGQMAASLAHDFNNLLTVILGHSSQLLGEIDKSHSMHPIISDIQTSAVQCAWLAEQLLAVGRKQHLCPVIFNLNFMIAGVEAIVRALLGKQIVLDLQLDASLRLVNADPAQVERVLINLAANARDAMPDGGHLVIATANAELEQSSVSAMIGLKPGPHVRLTVTDNGVGMSEEVKARIFDPFFTTKPLGKGTGLGLSIVYGVVKQSGGFISVDSQPGTGACFTILLPAAEAQVPLHAASG